MKFLYPKHTLVSVAREIEIGLRQNELSLEELNEKELNSKASVLLLINKLLFFFQEKFIDVCFKMLKIRSQTYTLQKTIDSLLLPESQFNESRFVNYLSSYFDKSTIITYQRLFQAMKSLKAAIVLVYDFGGGKTEFVNFHYEELEKSFIQFMSDSIGFSMTYFAESKNTEHALGRRHLITDWADRLNGNFIIFQNKVRLFENAIEELDILNTSQKEDIFVKVYITYFSCLGLLSEHFKHPELFERSEFLRLSGSSKYGLVLYRDYLDRIEEIKKQYSPRMKITKGMMEDWFEKDNDI